MSGSFVSSPKRCTVTRPLSRQILWNRQAGFGHGKTDAASLLQSIYVLAQEHFSIDSVQIAINRKIFVLILSFCMVHSPRQAARQHNCGIQKWETPLTRRLSVSKKFFRHAVRILKLSKKFQNPVWLNARGAYCPPHTPPAALSHKFSTRFFDSLINLAFGEILGQNAFFGRGFLAFFHGIL